MEQREQAHAPALSINLEAEIEGLHREPGVGHIRMCALGKVFDLPKGRVLVLDRAVRRDVEALEESAFLLTVSHLENLSGSHACRESRHASPRWEGRMKVKEIMRAPRAILSPEVRVAEALNRLRQCAVPSLPVAKGDGNLLGLVTMADLSQLATEAAESGSDAVRQHLSPRLVTATPDMDVSRLAEMMRYKGVENIMVAEGRTLVGALSLEEASRAA